MFAISMSARAPPRRPSHLDCALVSESTASASSPSRFRRRSRTTRSALTRHVFKVGGKSMFVILTDGPPVKVTMKLTKEERQVALEMPYVSEARYVGRYGWVTAAIEDEHALDAALEWIRESYWLKAPADVREAAWA